MYRRYYSYNDMPQIMQKKEEKREEGKCEQECKDMPEKNPAQIEIDDIILGIVILAILLDDSEDHLLLAALAVIFLSGLL